MTEYVCEELIVEIFTRLPPKSLLRFRSLSKSWYSCIGSPDFIRMHTFRSPQILLIRHEKYQCDYFSTLHSEDQLPLCPISGYFGITPIKFPYIGHFSTLGSCDGILCLFNCNRISLWNPSVRRKLLLPECPRRCYPFEIGFGFDPITDDYKIVVISIPRYGQNPESSFVYTMKTGVWCAIASPASLIGDLIISKSCFVNGKLHWLVKGSYGNPDHTDRCYIMTFDLSSHVFGMIALPELSSKATKLTIIQGSLAMISMGFANSWIWVWRDASWSMFIELKTYTGHLSDGHVSDICQLISNDDILVNTFYVGFQVHNSKTGKQSRLVCFDDYSRMVGMVMYVESVQLLDMGTANDLFTKEKDEER